MTKVLPHKKQTPKYNNSDLCIEEVDELRAAFKIFEDENQKINPKNIAKIFIDLGYDTSNKNIIAMFQYLKDVADEEELINFDQFLEGCVKFLGRNSPDEDMKAIYDMFVESESNVSSFLI